MLIIDIINQSFKVFKVFSKKILKFKISYKNYFILIIFILILLNFNIIIKKYNNK